MATLPRSDIYLLVRTYFEDEPGWGALREVIERGSEEGHFATVEFVDDAQFDGFSADALVAVHPHKADGWDVMYVADQQAITVDGHPLLVVRVGRTKDIPFRCRADVLHEVDPNLSLANLDWDDFRDQIGQSGVYGDGEPAAPVDHTAGRTYLAAARAAADRINTDLDRSPGHRILSGNTGTAEVEWTYLAPRSRLFLPMAFLNYWTSASTSGARTVEVGAQYSLSHNQYREIWDGIPTSSRGHVFATLVEVSRPKSVVTRWEWLDSKYYGQGQQVLGRPTTLTVRLDESTANDGQPRTTVHLEHDGLPTEWLDDMRTCWLCKLEAGEGVFPLTK